ncbi:ABC transporter substrate-binding protein [Vreelandella nigrificans]|uniref:Putative aliphatic sulfonates-binding protein n=1 Tax=Vreelandella nigrificans TaxID=2042704 RepID=A0A2A4HME1_9GAMM|nr:ABC transporter substrate-binding protein [Halomonas nigrificans]PCF95539.1 sulfonate ABC transporter substrate-binding protein [Halomonas nigrificans]
MPSNFIYKTGLALLVSSASLIPISLLANEPITLRIADQKGNMRAQLDAANALEGAAYTVQWSEFPAAAPLAEALNAGAIDAGIIGDAPLLFALAAGADIKAIAVNQSDPYGTAVLVNGDSAIETVEELRGRNIATGRGSIGHYVALRALDAHGLTQEDVNFRFMGPVDARIALATGAVDAWSTWEPYTAFAELQEGARIIANGRGLTSGNSFIAATDSAISDPAKHAALKDYLLRLRDAQTWSYDHIDEYAATLAEIIGFPEDAAKLQYQRRQLAWRDIDEEIISQQQLTADFYLQVGLIPDAIDVETTFDRSFTFHETSEEQP